MSEPSPGRSPAPVIAVVGAGDVAPTDPLAVAAAAVGAGLARAGAVVVTGGLEGVMAAACRGASAGGGVSVGLLPGVDAAAGNPWLTVALPTGLGEARNALVVRAARVVIAVGGGWGTLSEVALARRVGIPVVSLHGWRLARADGAPPPDGPIPAADPADAVRLALSLAADR